jgi:hypothetical protein
MFDSFVSDYSFYRIGSFDSNTGIVKSCEPLPEFLLEASAFPENGWQYANSLGDWFSGNSSGRGFTGTLDSIFSMFNGGSSSKGSFRAGGSGR